jgi:hypothetical protein
MPCSVELNSGPDHENHGQRVFFAKIFFEAIIDSAQIGREIIDVEYPPTLTIGWTGRVIVVPK